MAALSAEVLLPTLTASAGIIAAIFTALRFNRDDTTAVVGQQSTVLTGMQALIDELAGALERSRAELERERDRARLELELEIARREGLERELELYQAREREQRGLTDA